MKQFIATLIHIVAVLLLSWAVFPPFELLFQIESPGELRNMQMISFALGLFLFYVTYAVMLREGWQNKNLREIKILKVF